MKRRRSKTPSPQRDCSYRGNVPGVTKKNVSFWPARTVGYMSPDATDLPGAPAAALLTADEKLAHAERRVALKIALEDLAASVPMSAMLGSNDGSPGSASTRMLAWSGLEMNLDGPRRCRSRSGDVLRAGWVAS